MEGLATLGPWLSPPCASLTLYCAPPSCQQKAFIASLGKLGETLFLNATYLFNVQSNPITTCVYSTTARSTKTEGPNTVLLCIFVYYLQSEIGTTP